MRSAVLRKVFLRSLLIQGSWNFWRMQNLGFAYAMMPLLEEQGDRVDPREFLLRHLQRFNTHPVFTAPILGAVSRLEEEGKPEEASHIKETLMAPYAALGDSLFGNSLRPCSAAGGLLFALQGALLAPLVYLVLYTPLHLWIRFRGFTAGCERGKESVDFIRAMNIPQLASKIRWCAAVLLGVAAFVASDRGAFVFGGGVPLLGRVLALAVILGSFLAVKKSVPVTAILYGSAAALGMVFALV